MQEWPVRPALTGKRVNFKDNKPVIRPEPPE